MPPEEIPAYSLSSHVALRGDIEHAAGGDPQGGDYRQGHEAQGHEGVNARIDAQLVGPLPWRIPAFR